MKLKQNNKGFSLVELAIGLAVITVLILAVSMSSGIRDSARVQSAVNSVQALHSAAEGYLALGNLDYTKMGGITVLKNNNLLPSRFNDVGSNPWGGNFGIAQNTSNATKVDIVLTSVAQTDAGKLDAYFNNIANGSSYDAGKKTWTVTF